MKKPAGKGRSRRPPGRTPVIAVRAPALLYRQIKDAAKQSGQTMSETMAMLLTRAFEWDATFAETKRLSAEFQQRMKSDLKMEMRRQGWRPLRGSPYWLPPEVADVTPPQEGAGFKKVDPIEMALTQLERCAAILKAIQPKKEEEPQ